MRPAAPSTPTRLPMTGPSYLKTRRIEGAERGEGSGPGEDPLGHPGNVRAGHRPQPGEMLVNGDDFALADLAAADAGHSAPGVLEPEEEGPLEIPQSDFELAIGDPRVEQAGDLVLYE